MMTRTLATFLEQRLQPQQYASGEYSHWRLRRDDNNILWVLFDKHGSRANTLDTEVLKEFDHILDSLGDNPPRALVLRSLKAGGFCAGADIGQFVAYGQDEVRALLRQGHEVLDRLEALHLPTIAVVHGHCLGGGLELALACRQRIGISGALEMGFPEIMLGLHPGLGGTFRLTGLINPVTAMTMMLTGRSVHNRQALQRGLVDALVLERHLDAAVSAMLNGRPRPRRQSLLHQFMNTRPVRQLAARPMQAQARQKAPEQHYPAPSALIRLWLESGGDRQRMQPAEIDSFARLLDSATSRNLVRVFFLREGLKETARGDNDIKHVHVIGAGAMGGDIATWCAMQGCRVTLSDVRPEPIGAALKSVSALCRSRHKSGIETRDTYDRLIPDLAMAGAGQADLVIEAVPENPELKRKIYQDVEPRLKPGAILATNTSSIPLTVLASYLQRPERLVGIHFFNPVPKMMVVEVVAHDQLDTGVYEQALSFTRAIGKLPVPVQSYPGFLVNRALMPYLLEAVVLLDEGVDKAVIDQAAVDFGMPMGPVELADQVGLDICVHVARVLRDALHSPMAEIPQWLHDKVERGELGRKSGQGFYSWKQGKAKKEAPGAAANGKPEDTAALADRLLLPLLNACIECYRQGVIRDLDHLDAAMIFATGFAPFRGGPMHYARTRGIPQIVAALKALADKHGERFTPDPGWQDIQ